MRPDEVITDDLYAPARLILEIIDSCAHISSDVARRVKKACLPVLADPGFATLPAAVPSQPGQPVKHHGYEGGLAQHTTEVLRMALGAARACSHSVDWEVLIIGCVWHDVGKLQEYVRHVHVVTGEVTFGRVRDPELLSHICRGLMMWAGQQSYSHLPRWQFEHVAHLIASHHGRKEWGSPVLPATLEAVILHNADMQSVMLDSNNNPAARGQAS